MFTTYHLKSAEDINVDLVEAIKALYKTKPITIIVQENEENAELTEELKDILDMRLAEDEETYLSAKSSLDQLKEKYGL